MDRINAGITKNEPGRDDMMKKLNEMCSALLEAIFISYFPLTVVFSVVAVLVYIGFLEYQANG